MPPPSTRSSSASPVGMRAAARSVALQADESTRRPPPAGAGPGPDRRGRFLLQGVPLAAGIAAALPFRWTPPQAWQT